ncbi:MAG: hypothetical protein ACJ8AJ_09255 [Gemmatimonadaceae bacterium]
MAIVAGRALLLWTSRCLGASGIAALVFLTACYTYPSRSLAEVPPSAVVSAKLNDVGRVALSEPVGSGIDRISGQVVQQEDTAIRLMVSEVHFLNGLTNKWSGQEVTLRPQYVSVVSQRTYSRQRTMTAVIFGAVLAAAAFAVGLSGIFSGNSGQDKPGEPPPTS